MKIIKHVLGFIVSDSQNDMMLGILQEEERSFEDSENFSVKLHFIQFCKFYIGEEILDLFHFIYFKKKRT
ncbi:hypothetical protein Avbf_15799 [Armadillidium vulgare]|nr:hypothetical protein Avbf_15799 [Armadillidium vulgare]